MHGLMDAWIDGCIDASIHAFLPMVASTRPYLGTQITKLRVVQTRLLFRQLRECHAIIQIKDEIRQCLRDTGI